MPLSERDLKIALNITALLLKLYMREYAGKGVAKDVKDANGQEHDELGRFGEGGGAKKTSHEEAKQQEIDQVIDKALNDPNARQKVDLGKVDKKLVDAAKKAGLDIEGYTHDIDVSGVRHALREHGNAKREGLRGQLAITKDDFRKIPDVIKNYDSVDFTGKTNLGREAILYKKERSDGVVYYVEEVRTGRKTLTIQTMYKQKKK